MTLGGLWHGASWHFVVWGVYHGLLLVVFHLFQPRKAAKEVTLTRRSDVLFWGKAFLYFHLTCLGWLLFRAENLTQVARLGGSLLRADTFRGFLGVQAGQLAVLVIPLLALEIVQHRSGELEPWRRWPVWGRVLLNLIVLYAILLLGVTENNDFIYFQF
jgi:D-alanyl-lipoteichoic acid acyltransferase DltB (MBOAT superfamily)